MEKVLILAKKLKETIDAEGGITEDEKVAALDMARLLRVYFDENGQVKFSSSGHSSGQ